MADTLTIEGILYQKGETIQINSTFRKREFVLDITEPPNADGKTYPNYAKMQATQDRCDTLNNFQQGQKVKVSFNVRGNKWEKDGKVNFITNLDAWKIEAAGTQTQQPQQSEPPF